MILSRFRNIGPTQNEQWQNARITLARPDPTQPWFELTNMAWEVANNGFVGSIQSKILLSTNQTWLLKPSQVDVDGPDAPGDFEQVEEEVLPGEDWVQVLQQRHLDAARRQEDKG